MSCAKHLTSAAVSSNVRVLAMYLYWLWPGCFVLVLVHGSLVSFTPHGGCCSTEYLDCLGMLALDASTSANNRLVDQGRSEVAGILCNTYVAAACGCPVLC